MGRTVTRMVPVQRDGKTHLVTQEIPVPRDWDAIVLGAACTIAPLAVAGAITWSTVAIGGLLSAFAPAWAAYLVAGVFDLAWVVCMALEWLCRYDRARARLPIACGWVALGLSVSLITLHGASSGGTDLLNGEASWSRTGMALGLCGGTVSVIAKGIGTVVMRHMAVALDPASEAWLTAERAEVNSVLASTSARRQLARTRARIAAEAYALDMGQPWDSGTPQDNELSPVPVLSQDSPETGQDRDTETVPVPRTALDSSVDGLSELSGRQLPRAFVRGLLSADPGLSNAELAAAVRAEYGPDKSEDSIKKTIQRARGDLSQAG